MRKISILIYFTLFFLIFTTCTSADTLFAGGSGTSGDPFQISNCQQLQNINSGDLGASYILTQDIDCNTDTHSGGALWNDGAGFSPIGSDAPFTGSFDGKGYKVSNLFENSSQFFTGLFSQIQDSTLTNFALVDENITGLDSVGGAVGYVFQSTVTKVYTTGNISGGSYTGGLVGFSGNSHIENTYSTASVVGSDNVGGLVGGTSAYSYPFPTSVVDSYAIGNVSGISRVGGLIGSVNNDPVSNSFSTGKVTGSGSYVGGFIGYGGIPSMVFNNGWYFQNGGPVNAIGETGSGSGNITFNIKNGGGEGFIDGDQSWFYDKTRAIFTTINNEPSWDFNTPIWYGHSSDYPNFIPETISHSSTAVSHGQGGGTSIQRRIINLISIGQFQTAIDLLKQLIAILQNSR